MIKGPVIEGHEGRAGAIILAGVKVCAGSIVGIGAVVTKDVTPKKLVRGIPARIVKDID